MGAPPTPPGTPPPDDGAGGIGLTETLEQQLVGNREVHFQTKRVQPPAALYVTGDDNLYVAVSNVQAGLALTLTATMLLPDGRVQASAYNMTPPATGAQTVYLFPLAECFLLNVSLMPASAVRYGATWVFCCIRRGGIPSGINLQTLISDYVDAFGGPSWPSAGQLHTAAEPGLMMTTYVPSVAVGSDYVFTVPSYARVLLRSLTYVITSSASVGNRNLAVQLTDPSGNLAFQDFAEPNLPASQTAIFSYALGRGAGQTAFATGSLSRTLPEVYLLPGAQVKVHIQGVLAGDQLTAVTLYYEQWYSF